MEKQTLLIADDVEMNRTVIKRLLGNDFQIMEAADGREVIATLGEVKIDVIILDIIMPEMDGLEVLKEMKKHPEWKHIGVLVATSVKEKTERLALSCGADDVVAKPYDPIVIKQRIINIMAKKEMDKLEAEDVRGISAAKRRSVDHTLESILGECGMIRKNLDNPSLTDTLTKSIQEEVQFLLELLTHKEEI